MLMGDKSVVWVGPGRSTITSAVQRQEMQHYAIKAPSFPAATDESAQTMVFSSKTAVFCH